MGKKFVKPISLVVSVFKRKVLMINSFLFPFSLFIENEEFSCYEMTIDHFQVKMNGLLEMNKALRTPIVLYCDRDNILQRNKFLIYPSKRQHFKSQVI